MSKKQRYSIFKEVHRQKIPNYKRYTQTTQRKVPKILPKKTIHLSTDISGLDAASQRTLNNDFFAIAAFMVSNLFFAGYMIDSVLKLLGYQLPLTTALLAFALLCLTRGKGLLFGALATLLVNFILT